MLTNRIEKLEWIITLMAKLHRTATLVAESVAPGYPCFDAATHKAGKWVPLANIQPGAEASV